MIRFPGEPSVESESLFEQERPIGDLPLGVRARIIARATAALQTGEHRSAPPRPATAALKARWALVGGLLFFASAAGGAAAYGLAIRAHRIDEGGAAAPEHQPLALGPTAEARATTGGVDEPTRPRRERALRTDADREERRILEPARVAVARGDFAAAMPPIAEHARRFKRGRLAEEREALRVEALAGLGRRDEANRAAAAFVTRFPRSPLLSTIGRLSSATP
ncbi:MAG TPA: hypothetical protein VHO06_20655 [Polyangia bacterium]|nr:hypothetical protein [Polyangia bacterium]